MRRLLVLVLFAAACGEAGAFRSSVDGVATLDRFTLDANGAPSRTWSLDEPLPRVPLTLRTRLPAHSGAEPTLFISQWHGELQVAVDGADIAQLVDTGSGPVSPPAVIALPADCAGRALALRFTPGPHPDMGPHGHVAVGSRADIALDLLRRARGRGLLAVFSISVGVLALALWSRRRGDLASLALAVWMIAHGLIAAATLDARVLLPLSPTFWNRVLPSARALAPAAMLAMVIELFGATGWVRKLAKALLGAGIVLALLAVADVEHLYPLLWRPLNAQWLACTGLTFAAMYTAVRRRAADARPFVAAFAVLALASLHDALLAMHVLAPQPGWETVAEGVFVGTVAMIVLGRLAKVHEALAAHARELETANARLREIEARLTEALASRDEFISVASHELRTPMTALLLQVQLLRKVPASAARLAVVERQVGRLERLTSDLLDVTRLHAGRLELRLERVDLLEAARDTAERMRDDAERAGTELRVEGEEGIVGAWDRSRTEQIVTNLLSNAVKYGAGKPVRVRVQREGPRAVLEVEDQGAGIARKDHARIFERFERAVSARNYGGLGLGLWIAREITAAMGGRISVASEEGRGATFRVELPVGSAPVERS